MMETVKRKEDSFKAWLSSVNGEAADGHWTTQQAVASMMG